MQKLLESTFAGKCSAFLEITPLSYWQSYSRTTIESKVALRVFAVISICAVSSALFAVARARVLPMLRKRSKAAPPREIQKNLKGVAPKSRQPTLLIPLL